MGVIFNKEVQAGCRLGIWKINENYRELRVRLSLESEEIKTLESFRNHARKMEWLSVRNLINELTGKSSRIVYNEDRKPFLLESSYNLSISHSRDLTSILISRFMRVGIDMEYMSHKISRIAGRFINESEKITEDPDLLRYHLYIHWCAKEALYKICDKKNINFKRNLRIEPFEPLDRGSIVGTVDKVSRAESFLLNYFRMDNYIIVWCCK